MQLKLAEELKNKEIKKFGIPNTLTLKEFNAYQYCMCFCAIRKGNSGNYEYAPEYSQQCINSKIKVNEALSFIELHKNIFYKEKVYDGGHFLSFYYVVYLREEKPSIINEFKNFNTNNIDVEIIINENGYYRVDEIHLQLSPYNSIIGAIKELFSIENNMEISFINQTDNNQYEIVLYNDLGQPKNFVYPNTESIFDRIISVRLVGCTEIFNE